MKTSLLSEKGFSLIEALVAVAVLTIGVLAMNVMQTTAIKGNSTSKGLSASSNWATDRIEQLLSQDYDAADLDDGDGDGTNEDADNDGLDDDCQDNVPACAPADNPFGLEDSTVATADGNDSSPDDNYNIFWNVAEDEPMPNIKWIRVHVVRSDRGVQKATTMNYYLAKF